MRTAAASVIHMPATHTLLFNDVELGDLMKNTSIGMTVKNLLIGIQTESGGFCKVVVKDMRKEWPFYTRVVFRLVDISQDSQRWVH